ncbi:MAG TPA: type IV toxin-antitoxin system AbiEi family antitoxin domain-containing protein [Longimicrobiales bacterium]|nr:type IV toxin-antitoxin system AbiEi family antitoxin domain-containing protein [Longimicrobiales bacterium]
MKTSRDASAKTVPVCREGTAGAPRHQYDSAIPIVPHGVGGRVDVDALIDSIAAWQHGVVTRSQLLAAGVSADAVDRRLGKGRLRRIHRGVHRVGPVESPHAHAMAACLACGPAAAICHPTASGLWQLVDVRERSSLICVIDPVGNRDRPGIRIRRVATLRADDVTRLESIPITTPARTLLDLSASSGRRQTERALAEALARRLTSLDEIRTLLEHHAGRPGTRMLRTLLAGGQPVLTRSEAEERFLTLVRSAKLDPPEVNVRIAGHEVDFLWRRHRLVVEIDGWAFHSSSESFESDRRRDAVLVAAGLRVVRITWRQLMSERAPVLARLAQALAAAAS